MIKIIIEDLINYALQYNHYADITGDIMESNSSAICFRQLGSNVVLSRYVGGGTLGTFSFGILCKAQENERVNAIEQLEFYRNLFDMNGNISLSNTTKLINAEVVSDIELVNYTDNKDVTFGMTFKLMYEEE